jgi:hypothetical protein
MILAEPWPNSGAHKSSGLPMKAARFAGNARVNYRPWDVTR